MALSGTQLFRKGKGDFQFLHLKDVEVEFKNNKRPKFPVKIRVVPGRSEPLSKEFESESGDVLCWEIDIHLSPKSDLEVIVKESHTVRFLTKKDYATVRFESGDIGKKILITKEDEEGLVSVRLTFNVPVTAGNVVRSEAENAAECIEKKPIALEKLGRARSFIETVMNFGDLLGGIHPAAKVAVVAFNVLYGKLENQEKLHADASDLIEELTLFLPFTEVVNPASIVSESARDSIGDFLALFKETCEVIVKYSSVGILGDLLSSNKPQINRLENDFRKVKDRYDWSIKTDVWRASLKLEKYHDDEMLRLLQVSFSGPPGKEYYKTDRCCLEGTRIGVLEEISRWSGPDSEQKLFWMHGIAGSGKSAIANTIAKSFDKQRLLAGCFFSRRDDPDLRNPDKVIPSLAFHLSVWHQPYSTKLLSILEGEERNKLASKTVQEQFELLIRDPILQLTEDQRIEPPRPLIVVIDALDECGVSLRQRFHLAQVLVQVSQLVPWLKLFVTSRPLPEFFQVFEASAGSSLKTMHLNQAGDPTADIKLYTSHRADVIADENGLDPTWLTDEQINALTQKAQGLFIWTSTVFNFIQSQIDIEHAVEVVFTFTSDVENPEAALDDVYKMVLDQVGSGEHNLLLVKTVTGVIYSTARNVPLTIDAIHELIPQVSEKVIGRIVNQLQAVLYKDKDLQNAVRVCHPSFIDFMSQEARSAKFWTRPQLLDFQIAERCMAIMKGGLSFNICRLETSHLGNKDIVDLDQRMATEISRALSYSCVYYMNHLQGADHSQHDALSNLIGEILRGELALYWIETLSLLKELKRGIQILSQAIVHFTSPELKAIALDLFRFVSAFYDPISSSTPHLYTSALAWLPSECILARKIEALFDSVKLVHQGKRTHWPSTLLTVPESGLVRAVAYSKDGLHVASGTQEGVICIRDAQTGDLKGPPMRNHTGQIACVAFSRDGKLLASSAHDRTIRIWDVETGMPTIDALSQDTVSTSLAFFQDSKRVIAGSADGMIRVWDVEDAKSAREPIKASTGSIRAIAISPDDKYVAMGSDQRVIQIWDIESGQAVTEPLTGHTNWVVSLAFSPNGRQIASGSYDHTVRIWDVVTGKSVLEPFRGHTDYINSIAYSPDGKLVVSASTDKTVRVWDVEAGRLVGKPLSGHTNWVMSVAFSPDGKRFITGGHDKSIMLWDIDGGEFGEDPLKGRVTSVAFSPDGKIIASGSTEKIIQLWEAKTGKLIGEPFRGHDRWINSVAFSEDGKYLVSGSDDMTIRVWNVETHRLVGKPLEGHTGWVKSVTFSRDGKKIASGSVDKTVRLWDFETREPVGQALGGDNDWINAVTISPDGKHVASGSDDSFIRIWEIESSNMVGGPITGHTEQVLSVAYSHDGTRLASGSFDGTCRILDLDSGDSTIFFDYANEPYPIRSVTFSPDDKHLASGSDNKQIQIWDTQSDEAEPQVYMGHTARVASVAYARDGKHIASSSDDGTIRIWDTELPPDVHIAGLDEFPPSRVPGDGWIKSRDGHLLLWVPLEYRNGIGDMCSVCIPPDALDHPVRVRWDRLCHGTSWANSIFKEKIEKVCA